MKDREIALLVNEVTKIAKRHHDKGCLRELMSIAVKSRLSGSKTERITDIKIKTVPHCIGG